MVVLKCLGFKNQEEHHQCFLRRLLTLSAVQNVPKWDTSNILLLGYLSLIYA